MAAEEVTRQGPPRELLSGPVERVTFHNPENGFAVLRVAGARASATSSRSSATSPR